MPDQASPRGPITAERVCNPLIMDTLLQDMQVRGLRSEASRRIIAEAVCAGYENALVSELREQRIVEESADLTPLQLTWGPCGRAHCSIPTCEPLVNGVQMCRRAGDMLLAFVQVEQGRLEDPVKSEPHVPHLLSFPKLILFFETSDEVPGMRQVLQHRLWEVMQTLPAADQDRLRGWFPSLPTEEPKAPSLGWLLVRGLDFLMQRREG